MKLRLILFLLLFSTSVFPQRQLGNRPTETGGPLMFEQAVFDVRSYDISLRVDPAKKFLAGTTTMTAKAVIPTNVIVLDLDTAYEVSKIDDPAASPRELRWERRGGKIWIWFPLSKQVGDNVAVRIVYAGTPRVAPMAPWIGGFVWSKTPSGTDWISVALQNDGADLLFPCKDHPSDKPAEATMRITVPDPLFAVGPGKLSQTIRNDDKTTTYIWSMPQPIANYSIVFDAAPYRVIKDTVKSVTGEIVPIEFYILPESYENGPRLIEETKKYHTFFEKYLGPYPFRTIKLGIVETPHLGMEHSTHIAYGNKFQFAEDGFDWLMFHEYGHEWWANLVTASDWRDFWIHEGFQSFMDTLWVEETKGKEAYLEAMRNRARGFRNMQPVAPREPKISYQVYMAEPDYLRSDGDIYGKGAYILHTLRYLIGDDAFFRALRRMAYPNREMETWAGGRAQRLVTTDDFLTIAETECRCKLDWFFELYLRQPKLPRLVSEASGAELILRWETPNNMPFPMPIDVGIAGKIQRLEINRGMAKVNLKSSPPPVIDPKGWILSAK